MLRSTSVSRKTPRLLAAALTFALMGASVSCTPTKPVLTADTTDFDSTPVESILSAPAVPEPASEQTQQRALISFAGDTCLSSMQGSSAFNAVYDREGSAYFLSGVLDVFANDDYTVVNLENPLTTATARADKGEAEDEDGNPIAFWFKAPPDYVQILKDGSVEAVNLANNHILDYGTSGRRETEQTLTQAGIDYFIWETTLVKEINGIRIGFFGFSFDSNAASIRAVMDQLWADGAEVIVAYFHDGIEGTYTPSASQRAAATAAIDYGAGAVVMSHPHVIQGTGEYNGRFIAWSMGNFCYGGHNNPADKDSMIVQLDIVRTDTEITCTPKVIPCSITSTAGTNDYRPTVLVNAEAGRVTDKITEMSD